MVQNTFDDKSTLVQVMSLHEVTKLQWVYSCLGGTFGIFIHPKSYWLPICVDYNPKDSQILYCLSWARQFDLALEE